MRILVVIILMLAHALAQAQEMKLPQWILQAFAGGSSVAADSSFDARNYAAFGVDSLRPNRFIGTFKGSIPVTRDYTRFDFSGWTDTSRGSMALTISGQGQEATITYLADMPTNTAILAVSTSRGKWATVYALRDFLLWNPQARSAFERNAVAPTKRTRKVMGITCEERYKLESRDTLKVCASNIAHSPFVDAWNWMPLRGEGLFMAFGLLGSFGDPMPLQLTAKDLVIEITEVKQGKQPPPAFDLNSYPLVVEPKHDWLYVVNRRAPALHEVLKPPGSDTEGATIITWAGQGNPGSIGGHDTGGQQASSVISVDPDAALPPWLEVRSLPKRRVLKIPATPPIGARQEEVILMCEARFDGGIDLESAQVLVLDEEEYVFKQPPFSPNEQLALNMLSAIIYEPMKGASMETITFRFMKDPKSR